MNRLILFGTNDCPDCIVQKEILSDAFEDDQWEFVDIDSNYDLDQEIMAKYDINDPPTLLIIQKKKSGSDRVFRHVGIISASKINKFLKMI
ncbi:MAG: thioredoxin family protein [bacterium]